MARLSNEDIGTICDQEIRQALAYNGNRLSDQRSWNMRYYLGEKQGHALRARPGRSSVVLRDTFETVEWILPSLLRMFTSSDKAVEYQATQPGEDTQTAADDATDYINWAFMVQNPGFMIFYDWFKDALISKNGFVKYWWDVEEVVQTEVFEGLTDEQLALVTEDDSVEVVEAESVVGAVEDPLLGVPVPANIHTIKVRRTAKKGSLKIEGVAPENMLVSKWATTIDDAPFIAHVDYPSRTDLVEAGFKKDDVWDLPSTRRSQGDNSEEDARFDYDDTDPENASTSNKSMDRVLIYECYIRLDADDDGRSELLKVIYSSQGSKVMSVEEVERAPFADLCPIPMPHKFFGLSVAEIVSDLQEIRSTIMRSGLDNMYQTNNVRTEVPETAQGDHTLDDLANNVPGGWVRTSGEGGLRPLPVQPMWQAIGPMLEIMGSERESRAGVSRETQGQMGNLQTPGVAVDMRQQAANQRVELIGRIFADTGVKKMFRDLMKIAAENEEAIVIPNPDFDERMIGPDGVPMEDTPSAERFKEVDPSKWPEGLQVETRVGPGTGTRQAQIAMLQGVLAHQKELNTSDDPAIRAIATPQDIYEASLALVETADLRGGRKFFTNPQQAQNMMARQAEEQQQQQAAMMQQMQEMQAQMQAFMIQTKAQADMMEAEHQNVLDIRLQNVKDRNKMAQQEADNEDKAELEGFKAGTGG